MSIRQEVEVQWWQQERDMKHNLHKLAALVLFAVALTGAALAADDANLVRANIPIDFYVGGHLLPAGEYIISVNMTEHVITIDQKTTGSRSFLLGSPDDGSRDGRTVLTFTSIGADVYALHELQGPDMGLSFKAKAPQGTARAQNQTNKSVTVMAEAK